MLFNPFEHKNFTKTFEGKKNITTHIKEGDKNIIMFKKVREDKFYFKNLEQYLLAHGIYTIDEFYADFPKEQLENKFNKIVVKNVLTE